MIDKLGITKADRVLDPACGSGTFLIEAYAKMIGDDVEAGIADFSDVLHVLNLLAGNDLNTFSAVVSQIQMIWHLLSFKDQLKADGFPEIRVTEKANSLLLPRMDSLNYRFAEIDRPEYDFVIGNPPYVRAERSEQELDAPTSAWFSTDVSVGANLYTLFIYRALATWCKSQTEGQVPGRLAFVIPSSLFDSNETQDLRKLFEVGKKWTINAMIDLEAVHQHVFPDAKVIPVLLFAENRTATDKDVVEVGQAKSSSVHFTDSDRARFDFKDLELCSVPYKDIFTKDGRILTRLTKEREPLIKKLRLSPTLDSVAEIIWVRYEGSKIAEWSLSAPKHNVAKWRERPLIGGGVTFRDGTPTTKNGHDIYKGQNIVATELVDDPILKNIAMDKLKDKSLWRFLDILPEKGFAFPAISLMPVCAEFDPKTTAFDNTVTLLFPAKKYKSFPFDLLTLSRIYQWHYVNACRMGVLARSRGRSHLYPTNLAFLPWNDKLLSMEKTIESLREGIVQKCNALLNNAKALLDHLSSVPTMAFKDAVKAEKGAKIEWSDSLKQASYEVTCELFSLQKSELGYRVFFGNLIDWIDISDKDIAERFILSLDANEGASFDRSDILNVRIPKDAESAKEYAAELRKFRDASPIEEIATLLDKLDGLVAEGLGLSKEDTALIKGDLATDDVLSKMAPRYPGASPRVQGFVTSLKSPDRYRRQ